MKMDDVKVFCPTEDFLNHQHVVRQRVDAVRIQP
jgi:hypothetical protein